MALNKYHALKVKEATGYRKVIGRLVNFAENEIKKMNPKLSYKERILRDHDEPFWSAAKELRDLTREEKMVVRRLNKDVT